MTWFKVYDSYQKICTHTVVLLFLWLPYRPFRVYISIIEIIIGKVVGAYAGFKTYTVYVFQ